MTSQQVLIQEAGNTSKTELGHNHYSSLDFYNLCSGHNQNPDYFINGEGLTFRNYVGCKYLTGNELLYYPELALEIREFKEYPTLIEGLVWIKKLKG